ncbi:MAG: hypothetical protein AAFX03_06045 [Pseudomonadota bacterium]
MHSPAVAPLLAEAEKRIRLAQEALMQTPDALERPSHMTKKPPVRRSELEHALKMTSVLIGSAPPDLRPRIAVASRALRELEFDPDEHVVLYGRVSSVLTGLTAIDESADGDGYPPATQAADSELDADNIAKELAEIRSQLALIADAMDELKDLSGSREAHPAEEKLARAFTARGSTELVVAEQALGGVSIDREALLSAIDGMARLARRLLRSADAGAARHSQRFVAAARRMYDVSSEASNVAHELLDSDGGEGAPKTAPGRAADLNVEDVLSINPLAPPPKTDHERKRWENEAALAAVFGQHPAAERLAHLREIDLSGANDEILYGLRHRGIDPKPFFTYPKRKLRVLELRDFSALSGCAELTALKLSRTRVSDISAIRFFPKLKSLSLAQTDVVDLTPLAALTKLTHLSLCDTKAADLSPLSELKQLEELDLTNSRAIDLAPLAALPKLEVVYLSQTKVKDLGPVEHARRIFTPSGNLRPGRKTSP